MVGDDEWQSAHNGEQQVILIHNGTELARTTKIDIHVYKDNVANPMP
jgi:hypothetical protein